MSAQVLRDAGFEVRGLSDEFAIMDAIRDYEPELIVMDLEMPKASGDELTAVIRDQPDLLLTPIILLADSDAADVHRQALRQGADELLTKPAEPTLLVEAVRSRLALSRRLKRRLAAMQQIDQASGLMSRRAFLHALERHIATRKRHAGDGLLFLSLDNAERLVQLGGLGAEDMLLAHLGGLLRGHLAVGETAARFGRYSFALLALRADAEQLMQLARRIEHALRDKVLRIGRTEERASLSIGITLLADRADAITHVSRAESACWQAQAQGFGRIELRRAADQASASDMAADIGRDMAGSLPEAIVEAIANNGLEPAYRPLMPLAQAQPTLCAGGAAAA
jgi:diguanylate cyclase (GGDEF)-like protein